MTQKHKPTPHGKVTAAVASLEIGRTLDVWTVGAGRLVGIAPAEAPESTVCRIYERDAADVWTCTAQLAGPANLDRPRTSGRHLVACVGANRMVTAVRRDDGTWSALGPLPLPEVYEAIRDVLLQDDLIVVDSVAAGFAIYEWSRNRWLLRHQAPARALKRLGRPLAVNPRHDILVELAGGFAILARDVVGGWTKGPVVKIAPLYRGWSRPHIEAIHFTDDTLALGAPRDATDAPGHAGPVTGRTLLESGTVFVSSRDDDGTWRPFTTLMPPRPRAHGRFGTVLGGNVDGALLVASVHDASRAMRPFVFARDAAGTWQLRTQLPDVGVGWMAMDGATVFHAAAQGGRVDRYAFGADLLDLPAPRTPRRRRVRKPTADLSYFIPEVEGGMGELLAASDDLVAVSVGAEVHVLRFRDSERGDLVTEHVIAHEEELLPGALAVDQGRVVVIWESLGDRVATPQGFVQHEGAWRAEPMGSPSGQDGGWAEPCVVLAGDWLVYGRRGDADGHPSYLCGWRFGADGWRECFEVRWPRSPHSIAIDRATERLLVASEWEDRVEVCRLTEAGPVEARVVTDHGGPSVFHDDAVLVARRDGITWYWPEGAGWVEGGRLPLVREVTDDVTAEGDLVYVASSLVGGGGEVHVLGRDDAGAYARCLVFRDYCQRVEGYDVGGTLAIAGHRALVGFEHRFDHLGGIQIATLAGVGPEEPG